MTGYVSEESETNTYFCPNEMLGDIHDLVVGFNDKVILVKERHSVDDESALREIPINKILLIDLRRTIKIPQFIFGLVSLALGIGWIIGHFCGWFPVLFGTIAFLIAICGAGALMLCLDRRAKFHTASKIWNSTSISKPDMILLLEWMNENRITTT